MSRPAALRKPPGRRQSDSGGPGLFETAEPAGRVLEPARSPQRDPGPTAPASPPRPIPSSGPWTEAELARWIGFCPRCRRVIWVAWEAWRIALPGERANVLGYFRAHGDGVSDVLPRDRAQVAGFLGPDFTAFSLRIGPAHDCQLPEARKHPKRGWEPLPRRGVYDLGE